MCNVSCLKCVSECIRKTLIMEDQPVCYLNLGGRIVKCAPWL